VVNTDATDCPPFGAMMVVGRDADGRAQVARPSADNLDPRLVLFADAAGVKKGGRGQGTYDLPWYAAQAAASGSGPGTADNGDELGTVAGKWTLAPGSGYIAWWADDDTDTAYVTRSDFGELPASGSGAGSGGGGGSGSGGTCVRGIPIEQLFDPITCQVRRWCIDVRGGHLVLVDPVTGAIVFQG
jgi:hypothetical protein